MLSSAIKLNHLWASSRVRRVIVSIKSALYASYVKFFLSVLSIFQ